MLSFRSMTTLLLLYISIGTGYVFRLGWAQNLRVLLAKVVEFFNFEVAEMEWWYTFTFAAICYFTLSCGRRLDLWLVPKKWRVASCMIEVGFAAVLVLLAPLEHWREAIHTTFGVQLTGAFFLPTIQYSFLLLGIAKGLLWLSALADRRWRSALATDLRLAWENRPTWTLSTLWRAPCAIRSSYWMAWFALLTSLHLLLLPSSVRLYLISIPLLVALQLSIYLIVWMAMLRWQKKRWVAFGNMLLVLHLIEATLLLSSNRSLLEALYLLHRRGPLFLINETQLASGAIWGLLGTAAVALVLGPYLYSRCRERSIAFSRIVMATILLGGSIQMLARVVQDEVTTITHQKVSRTLPLASAFPRTEREGLTFPVTLPGLPKPREMDGYLSTVELLDGPLPDIYLFVLETFRGDYVTAAHTPHLAGLRGECPSIAHTLPASTSTWHSWYGLFHSRWPHELEQAMREEASFGSLPLRVMKKLGYRIHAIADPGLVFQTDDTRFGEEWRICNDIYFGKKGSLLDSTCQEHNWSPDLMSGYTAYRDEKVIDSLIEQSEPSKGGNLYLVFLDAGHYQWSWLSEIPDLEEDCYTPEEIKGLHFKVIHQPEHQKAYSAEKTRKIRNSYRNTMKGVDHQVGRFFDVLRKRGRYDEALIVVTGDHGESLLENDLSGHGKYPWEARITVPQFYKFPKTFATFTPPPSASHVDIFPTIFDFLGHEKDKVPFTVGTSILRRQSSEIVITATNGRKHPSDFVIHNGEFKLHGRFSDPTNIYNSSKVEIWGVTDLEDREVTVPDDPGELTKWVEERFGEGCASLYL